MKRLYSLTIVGIATVATLLAQDMDRETKKIFKDAEGYYEYEEYSEALKLYHEADVLTPDHPEISFKIGVCMIETNYGVNSLPYFKKAENSNFEHPELPYYLAKAYHLNNKFNDAINYYDKYISTTLQPERKYEELIAFVNHLKSQCRHGILLVKSPVEVEIENLGPTINSKYPDYVPAISADETQLIFTSRRENSTGGEKTMSGDYYEDIYISYKDNNDDWSKPVNLPRPINTESHDAAVAMSPDGNSIFIYKSGDRDLYECDLEGNSWSDPKSLGDNINDKRSWEPSCTITADEKSIFFVSDREGGYGGFDIYFSRRQLNGEWGPARNMGPKINTKFDDDGPFIHPDGKTFYFSSKGHNSMGGFDIFKCEVNSENGDLITEPENVGYPINTAEDEIFFFWSADGKRAYFTSAREGGYGEKDIYVMSLKTDEENALAIYKGKITACDGKKPVTANITVTDLSSQEVIGIYNSNSVTGKYTVILPAGKNYGIAVDAKGYLFYSKNVDIPDLTGYEEIKDEICLESFKTGVKIALRNVFFDKSKATLRKESESELNRMVETLKSNPNVKIEIGGHTDSDGSDEFNQKLSADRAKAVVDYLVENGIERDRLSWKGYGETQPVAPNDSPENKQLNRRTELKVVD